MTGRKQLVRPSTPLEPAPPVVLPVVVNPFEDPVRLAWLKGMLLRGRARRLAREAAERRDGAA